MCGTREGLAIDRDPFCGGRAIDGDEDDAARRIAVRARIDDHILYAAGRGLQRNIPEIRAGAIEAAEGAETSQHIGIRAARRPKIRGEDAWRAENAEIIGLRDRTGDVIPAAAFVFRDGNFHARELGVNFRLQAAEEVDWSLSELVVNPRIAVVVVVKRRIPQVAWALRDERPLAVGQR